jgi:3'(2'), 5'-bisphosphate nucleotidase
VSSLEQLAAAMVALSHQAGEAILKVYNRPTGFDVSIKADDSPLTDADIASNQLLLDGLKNIIPLPVLSEEMILPDYHVRRQWDRYWLIDPLDGTKEFIKRSGEFTVNLALIEYGVPVLGVVYAPVSGLTYIGIRGVGAYKQQNLAREAITVRALQPRLDRALPVDVVSSRIHGVGEVNNLMMKIGNFLGIIKTKNMGSSLKLCLVAEGQADIYPRLALTAEWDTAAAQAVVEAAGGIVVDTEFKSIRYNTKADILNPFFYVIGDTAFNWREVIRQ